MQIIKYIHTYNVQIFRKYHVRIITYKYITDMNNIITDIIIIINIINYLTS